MSLKSAIKSLIPQSAINVLRKAEGRFFVHYYPRHPDVTQDEEYSSVGAFFSVIVPIHDSPGVTRRCLNSLAKYGRYCEVILIDDGSKLSETKELIRDFSEQCKVIYNERALGHSAACRDGAKLATRPILCLLNSDTIVTPWCWKPIKEAFDSDPNIAVAGPSTSDSHNMQTLPRAAHMRTALTDNQICFYAKAVLRKSGLIDQDWISGFAFFIRRTAWEQLGGFDENLPDYGNEYELCKRISKSGSRMVWVRNSYIHHFGGESYAKSERSERVEAGRAYTRRKHAT
jgi:GT2 family glycosyltransferase